MSIKLIKQPLMFFLYQTQGWINEMSKVPKNQQRGNGKLILVTCASALILASITFITLQLSGFAWYSSIIPALLLIAVLLYLGYTLGSSWTGFGYIQYTDG